MTAKKLPAKKRRAAKAAKTKKRSSPTALRPTRGAVVKRRTPAPRRKSAPQLYASPITEREQRQLADALRDMGATLNATLDSNAVLDLLLDQIGQVVTYDAANVMLVDADADRVRIAHLRGYERFGEHVAADLLDTVFEISKTPNLRFMAESKRPLIVPDVAADPDWIKVEATDYFRSWAGAPILVKSGEVIAFFSLDKIEPGFYQPKDAERLAAFAGQAALALQNARLFEESRRQVDELKALHAVALAGAAATTEDELIERATEVIGETLYPDNFGILLLDEAARVLRVHRSYRIGPTDIERADFPVDQGISGRVVASGQPRLAPDVSRDPDYFDADSDTRSELCVPLKIGERVIGVINAESKKLAAFSPADMRLLTTFAQQLATAIEKIRLFQAEHIAREQAEALREVAAVLNASIDREPLLQLILEQLARVVDYDSASLMLLSGNMLQIVAGRGFRSENQQLSSMQIEALNHLHEALERREPIIISDTNTDPRWIHVPGSEYIRCWLGVPLVAQNRVIGLLNLDKSQVGFYTERDAKLATAFAHQAVVAIENARLYQALTQDKRRLELLYALGQDLSARLDPEQLYEAIHRAVLQLMVSEVFMIALNDETQNDIEVVYLMDKGARLPKRRVSLDDSLSGHIIRTGESVLFADIDRDTKVAVIHLTDDHVRSVLAVPMRLGENVIGVLSAQSYMADVYTPDDQRTLGTLAYQAAIAIENARLFSEAQQRTEELGILFESGVAVARTLDLTAVLGNIAEQMARLMNATSAYVLSVDLISGAATVLAEHFGPEANEVERISDLGTTYDMHNHPQAFQALREGRPFMTRLGDMDADPASRELLEQYGGRSVLRVPLMAAGQMVGYAVVWDSRSERIWNEAELRLCQTLAASAASALDNAQLFEETRHRDNILEALAYASERLLMPGDLGNALPDLLAELGRAAGVSRVYVFKNHRSASGALLTSKQYEWTAPGLPDLIDDLINQNFDYVAQGFGRWVDTLGGGQPLAGVVRGFPAAERAFLQSENILSLVVAPIFSGGEWWGFLGFDACEHERNWLNAEIEALKNVAGALGAAFARQQTETDEREQRALAEALRDTAAALNGTLNFDEVLDRILANVGKVVPHDVAEIMLIESGTARIFRRRGNSPSHQRDWWQSVRYDVAETPNLRQMAETAQPLIIPDVQSDPGWVSFPETAWLRSNVGAPIHAKGSVIGFIILDSATPGFFTPAHAERLKAFADQAAVAIENAQLYDELSALYTASSRLINPGDDVRSLAQHIAEIVTREFPFAHCGVLVADEARTRLIVMGHMGLNNNISVEYVPLDGPGLIVAAFKSERSIYAPDTSADRRYLAAHPATRSEYVVPLRAGADTIGVLDMQSTELDAFDGRTQRIVAAFAQHAALALENAQLLTRVDQARRAAEEASQLKSEFLANTSHELRTPLTGIIGSLSVVIDELCDSREEEREFIQIAYTASQRLLTIISDVLDIAKIEAGKIEIQPQSVDVAQIFGEVQALTRLQAGEKKLQLEFLLPPDSPSTVWADPDRLRQILLNLVGNAIKFTEQGKIVVSVGVEAYGTLRVGDTPTPPHPHALYFSVRDTGIGVPLGKQYKLFQPFVQADGSTTRKYGGTGLGLSISRRLAELMGGGLTLHSEGAGQGSEFILTLPMSDGR